jgi:hypothetical protein
MQSKSTKIDPLFPSLLIAPALLLFAAACGFAVLAMIHIDIHAREMLAAFIVMLVAIFAGSIPLFLSRHADQSTAAQAGLVATIAHLFIATALAGAVILGLKPTQAFTYWLFAFYWTTLIGLAIAAVRLVKSAPLATSPAKQ